MDDRTAGYGMLRPTPARPLLGLTVLMVEDSRYACDALRLMAVRSGARIRRADCLRSARRHLEVYQPSVAVIDMGLPDGSGAELIAEMAAAQPRVPVLLGISGDPFAEGIALAAGADGFLAKPLESVLAFQTAVLSNLPPDWRPAGPRPADPTRVRPDPLAYRDDILHAAEVLRQAEDADYVARFLAGLARSAGDTALAETAARLLDATTRGEETGVIRETLSRMMAERAAVDEMI
ncbi:response regulator [Roseivivax sediminis]|uniref:Response regulator receiver domain-containing protein n=1 Tax=Roseivivax sediminis TaxID=936889 RepID=A0A1I2B6L0_9RHOB|nr:response regulator [Roseivivax sediminis]SFE51795.1 Response regulator receiver domain-containing protein [Roseivivax sediminis]